ncbi:alpha-amylase family protein [Aquimarina algicola]|uniref:Glycoside hydrolase family 42 n=1 Tax=Aquimarina algicola TaxID=2589995 RepID=A0A504JDH5_9FLAO|nr:glycoside hydrolase family 42 [Aquimarina algicola]TPN84421.1 glycoside hydrolase family 42 [Aquimarina algicola]
MSRLFIKYPLLILLICFFTNCNQEENSYNKDALHKIEVLQGLIQKAQNKSLDVTREETTLWFAKEFLKFANWDETNRDAVEKLFGYYQKYEEDKVKLANELPDFERKKVIEILDVAIKNLKDLIDDNITRRAAQKIDWQNIEVEDNTLTNNGRPVFLHDYFSKTVGAPLTDNNVYNDHLGAIYHTGSHLYEVNQDRPSNPYMLNEDGTFDEKLLSYITEVPDTNIGFLLFWNMGVPDWMKKKEPEIGKGRSLFTGFDIDNPLVRDVWSKVIKKTGEVTKDKKVTQLGYILSNEPHWFSEKGHWTYNFLEMNSISSYTLNKFRVWLSKKYDDEINTLNKNWQSNFKDFDGIDIEIPMDKAKRGTPIWYDWCRYNMDRGTEWFTFLQNELRSVNPDADTHIKIMAKLFVDDYRSHGVDYEALTELTSMIGDDAKITGGRNYRSQKPEKWEENYAFYWNELAHSYDFQESVSPQKIHINSEGHFLSTSGWRELDTPVDYVRSSFWLATLHGMDVSLSWFWARDPDGSPEDRLEGELNFFDPALAGSYAGSVNMQPHVVNEVSQVMYDLNSFSEEILALRDQRRPLRLFHSETSAINKKYHMTEHSELYESLYFEGLTLGFATEKIIQKQDHSNWDVIAIYKTEYVTDSEFLALQSYLDQGGTIIIDSTNSLSKNEYGQIREERLTSGNGNLIYPKESNLNAFKELTLSSVTNNISNIKIKENNSSGHKSCTWRISEDPKGKGYIMTIINLGKTTADLKISCNDSRELRVVNMLNGSELESSFKLESKGVLLINITKGI